MANFGTFGTKKKSVLKEKSTTPTSYDPNAYKTNATQRQTAVNDAYNAYVKAFNDRTQIGDYKPNADVQKLYDDIMNAPEFNYDFNADQTYKNLAERYRSQGKMAMKDTMGQAAALNGGLGTSYSQMVGQQVYNQYMQELADYIPQLEEKAYGRYQDDIARMYERYNLALGLDDREYGRYKDKIDQEYTDDQMLLDMYLQQQGQANADREFDLQAAGFEETKNQNYLDNKYRNEYFNWQKETDSRDYNQRLFESGLRYDENGNLVVDTSNPEYKQKLYEAGLKLDENGEITVDTENPLYLQRLYESGLKLDKDGNIVENYDTFDNRLLLYSNGYKMDEDGNIRIDPQAIKTNAQAVWNKYSDHKTCVTKVVEYLVQFDLTDEDADDFAVIFGFEDWDSMLEKYEEYNPD